MVAAVAASLLVWSLVSQWFEERNVTAPMAFVAIGLAVANDPLHLVEVSLSSEGLRGVVEIALAVVLFADAATVAVPKLRRDAALPGRLLLIGLPLTMALGTVVAHVLLPGSSWWVSAVVGAAVAPTDAALGAAIIEDVRIPARIRRVLNVESGLNDGIATPFVNVFLVAAVAGTSFATESEGRALIDLGIGALVGAVIGAAGARAIGIARSRGISAPGAEAIGTVALPVLAYAGVVELGGNGFVSAFVAGLGYSAVTSRSRVEEALPVTHAAAEVLSGSVWFLFGALLLPVLQNAGWEDLAFAVVALTAIRMVPVAIALVGAGFDRGTVAMIGWFGPRGLASVVFALLAVDILPPADGAPVLQAIAATVVLSVVLHGVSAAPLARRWAASHGGSAVPVDPSAADG